MKPNNSTASQVDGTSKPSEIANVFANIYIINGNTYDSFYFQCAEERYLFSHNG